MSAWVTAWELLAQVLANAVGGELQKIEPRGKGGVAFILIGNTPWRVSFDPIERRTP